MSLSQQNLVDMMENVRQNGLSGTAIQDAMAQVAWAAWNAKLIDWESVVDACHRMGIESPATYWTKSAV